MGENESQEKNRMTESPVLPLDGVGLGGPVDDAVSSVTTRSLSLTGTSGVKTSDTGSSGKENETKGTLVENILVPKAVQNEEHYKQLLEQGKLRSGSIIKKKNRWSNGSQHVVIDADGNARRMPRASSQSSLVHSESSVEVSQPSQSGMGAPSPHSDTGSTGEEPRQTKGYKIREREDLNEFWVFIVNGLKLKIWEKHCGRILKQLSLVKWKVYMTRYPGHATKIAYRAQNKGADMIIAVGGDGTLQEVVDGMMRSHCKDSMGVPKAVLTVLPAGSSNDFHRSMGWSQDFEEALWRIGHRGETALVDVGKVTCIGPHGSPISKYWINISSFGVSGKISARDQNYRWFGPLKYKMAGFCECLKYIIPKKSPILMSFDGGEWEFFKNVTMVVVCNGHTFANGFKLSDHAHPCTGDLDIVVVKCGKNMYKVSATMDLLGKGMPSKCSTLSSRRCQKVDILAADFKGNPLEESMVYTVENGLHIAREDSTISFEDSQEIRPEEGSAQSLSSKESGRSSPNILKQIIMKQKNDVKKAAAHRYPVECDGECLGHLPASYEIITRAIKCRVPKDTSLIGSK